MFKRLLILFSLMLFSHCSKSDSQMEGEVHAIREEVPEVCKKIYGASQISIADDFLAINVNGTPDHGSPYFNSSDPLYENYSGNIPIFHLYTNRINVYDVTYKIPLHPREASNKSNTRLVPMGVAINGVALSNQYAGTNLPLTNEIDPFDQFNGHPKRFDTYHYHIEPLFLTQENGKEALLGFLLDGFLVYGPEENGSKVINNDLDVYHGHKYYGGFS